MIPTQLYKTAYIHAAIRVDNPSYVLLTVDSPFYVLQLTFIVFYVFYMTVSIHTEFLNDNRGSVVRQKKRIVVKKPHRGGERFHGRQSSNFQHSSISSVDEYSFVVTSESPSVAWKPITYSSLPGDAPKSARSQPSEVNAVPNGQVGHIDHSRPAESEQDQHGPSEPTNTDIYQDYALLHYYIPFQHIMVTNSKPIEEPPQERPEKPLSINQIMKAAIEPIAVFTAAASPHTTQPTSTTTTSTTTAAPAATTKPSVEDSNPEVSKEKVVYFLLVKCTSYYHESGKSGNLGESTVNQKTFLKDF